MDKEEFRRKFFEGISSVGFDDKGRLIEVKGYINSRSTGDME